MIKVIPSKSDLKKKEDIRQMNQRMSGIVNITYALAMAVESEAVDTGESDIREISGRLRAKINESCTGIAEDFGDWAEKVEAVLFPIISTHRLATLCFLTYSSAVRMQQSYRCYDPHFDFYQMEEIISLRKYASSFYLNTNEVTKANEMIKKIIRGQNL